ncbi:hypothetical protein EVAR_59924_1 [Eumeta japonica]|uniref:Uncharacterized protein n=1 Tax=Eumeta variegata TaxID=151549 RepID=A0A4C1YSG2_EUMVA|nr:hypothetical protein EVAR_59924_1 [Eumeta japonica]
MIMIGNCHSIKGGSGSVVKSIAWAPKDTSWVDAGRTADRRPGPRARANLNMHTGVPVSERALARSKSDRLF